MAISYSYYSHFVKGRPTIAPPSAGKVIGNGQMKDFSVGARYARTEKNPNGDYFVTMTLY